MSAVHDAPTAPETLRLEDVRRLDVVRARLCLALRAADTLTELRTHCATLAADLEEMIGGELAPVTERSSAAWTDDQAPSTPHASALGEEYGG